MQVGAVATAVEVFSDADAFLAATSYPVGDVLSEFEFASLPLKLHVPMLGHIAGVCWRSHMKGKQRKTLAAVFHDPVSGTIE